MGGGTVVVSVLTVVNGIFEVMATAGDSTLVVDFGIRTVDFGMHDLSERTEAKTLLATTVRSGVFEAGRTCEANAVVVDAGNFRGRLLL